MGAMAFTPVLSDLSCGASRFSARYPVYEALGLFDGFENNLRSHYEYESLAKLFRYVGATYRQII